MVYLRCLILVSLLGLLMSLPPHGRPQAQEAQATYQFVNLTLSYGGAADLYRNGAVAFFGSPQAELSPERSIPAGEQTFHLYPLNAAPGAVEPIAEISFEAPPGEDFLLLAIERAGGVEFVRQVIPTESVPVNRARYDLWHQSDFLPAILAQGQNGDRLIADLAPGANGTAFIPSGIYQMSFRDGDGAELAARTVNATAGTWVFGVLYGISEARYFETVRALPQLAAFRLIHGARVTPAVDVYLNELLLVAGVEYLASSDYLYIPPGDYNLAILPSGESPSSTSPYWEGQVTFSTTAPVTGVLFGERLNRLSINQDDHQLIPAEEARLRFVNVAVGLPSLTVEAGGELLVEGLEYALGSRNIISNTGAQSFIFRNTAGEVYATLENFTIEPNRHYTFVISGNLEEGGPAEVTVFPWDWQVREGGQ
jgi:hypothetical protein